MQSLLRLGILPYYKDKPCMNLSLRLDIPGVHLDAIVSKLLLLIYCK